jgi:hypothetical protein
MVSACTILALCPAGVKGPGVSGIGVPEWVVL